MPPKKTKAATGSQPVSASQPEPQKATRVSGRKRSNSDASAISDAPSGSQLSAENPAKKRKRGRPAATHAEPEVIVEEEEDVMVTDPHTIAVPNRSQDAAEVTDNIQVSQSSKHVHFNNGGVEEDIERSTATNITPHPRGKMPVKRRTMSPGTGGNTKRVKTSRTSLPSSLSQAFLSQEEFTDPVQTIHEYGFAPLRSVLQERVRRLVELKKKANASESELGEIHETMLVLDSQEETSYPQLSTAPNTPLSSQRAHKIESTVEAFTIDGEETAGARLRAEWQAERERYHEAIMALEKESNEAKANLRILTIELESLGFAEGGASALIVLQTIRESFAGVREFIELELPGTLPDDVSNQEVAETLIANVKEFANRLRTADEELQGKDTLIIDFRDQVNGLLDHLAEKEIRITTLQEQWRELDESNETKEKEKEELEEELQALLEEKDALEKERDDETERADGLVTEKITFEQSIERLTVSLQNYQKEETRLTALITKMEEDHSATVAAMNRERQETVQDLEDRLDAEMGRRGQIEQGSVERRIKIEELEIRITEILVERDSIREEVEAALAERDQEAEAKETVQADLEKRNVEAEDLEGRVASLEGELDELNSKLEELRQLNDNERQQREAAETDLDDRNQEIEDVNHKLREQGKQANELRQKLFEVQTNHAAQVKELETTMSERDDQFQADMAAEVERREVAEDLAHQRAATILQLETKLEEVEQEMRVLLEEKDERIASLQEDVEVRDADIRELKEEVRTFETERVEHQEAVDEFEASIAALKETIEEHEASIRDLSQQVVNSDESNAALNARIEILITEKTTLQTEMAGLERRVEQEAEQMLEMQNERADEAEALKATIREKQDQILVVQEKARAADESWQALLEAREEEIEDFKTSTTTTEETVTGLVEQNESIKLRFREYVRRSGAYIEDLQQQLELAKAAADEEGNALRAEGDGVLEELERMDVVAEGLVAAAKKTTVTTTTRTSSSHAASSSQQGAGQHKAIKKAKGRKKRVVDSGIGIDGGEESSEIMHS